jgi:nicotinamidase-related amidase
VDPTKTALLLMDFQPGIVARLPDSDALLERAASARAVARDAGVVIAYVRVAFADADYDRMPETNKTFGALAVTRAMHADAPETQIDDRLGPGPGEIIVRKVRVGAFSTTDLDAQLRARGIDTLILSGISTSGVVLSTVRDAADRDYRIYVLSDGVADPDAEVHTTLVGKVFPRQAHILTVDELSGELAAG